MEREIKLPVSSASTARRLLRNAGFQIHVKRVFERNLVLDDGRSTLQQSQRLLRLRQAGDKITCTFKGPGKPGRHKQRPEHEFDASSLPRALLVFQGLGYTERFRYEKFRTEFSREGERGVATVDETPIGCFLELEGAGRWIDRTARDLGFSSADYITDSYGKIYLDWCAEHKVKAANFAFKSAKR